MKMKRKRLREIVRGIVTEAAKEGKFQRIARNSFSRMIAKASTGGTQSSPPFTEKAPKPGKSGPANE